MSPAMSEPPKLVLLCDGTWCGRETDTRTNVQYLAEMIGIDMKKDTGPKNIHTFVGKGGRVKARYADGVGLGSTFLDYLFNGATGNDIAGECTEAYQYIVENYTPSHEIWMSGLSRGAFTVRCVAGMINNCGVVRPCLNANGTLDKKETATLCEEVYRIYRSHYEVDEPSSPQMQAFRARASHSVKTPVKFLGLFDTVGSLGIPHFTGGIGFDYPEFYDQKVSSVVENVYHAVSMHDRIWAFEPCLALRDPDTLAKNPHLEPIHEQWFPGAHYDLGRQRFRFFRIGMFSFLNVFGNTIEPNQVLSDLVLKWMLECIDKVDPAGMIIANIDDKRQRLIERIAAAPKTGSGDVYGDALRFIPFGKVIAIVSNISESLWRIVTSLLGVQLLLNILLALIDRRVPTSDAILYPYKEKDPSLGAKTATIETLAKLDVKRYPSRTYESLQLYRSVGGGSPRTGG